MRLEYFQLIDRILEIDAAGQTISVEAVVPETNTIFEGHFPGHPLMPGVLLVEAMAQSSGWLIISRTGFERMPFLASVKEAKFRNFVTPGRTLVLKAHLEHEGSGFAVTEAEVRAEGKLVCNATLSFRVMPFPNPDLRTHMEKLAARIGFPVEAPAHG